MISTKKTVFGIAGAAAAACLTVGFAAPAFASSGHDGHGDSTWDSSSISSTSTSTSADRANLLDGLTASGFNLTPSTNTWTPIVLSPSVSTGDLLSGNSTANGNTVGSQNPVLSGNDVTAPVASGNDTSVASGNSTPVASGNDTSVDGNAVASGNDVSNDVSSTTGDINSDVRDLVGGITGAVGLGGLGR